MSAEIHRPDVEPLVATQPPQITSRLVFRGVWHAYLWVLGILATLSLPAILNPLGLLSFLMTVAAAGLVLAIPAAAAALAVFYTLRLAFTHVRWWVAPLICAILFGVICANLAGTPLGAVWGLLLGPITGCAFWSGAAGKARMANLRGAVA